MPELLGFDCYSPREIAERVENVGVTKASLPLVSMAAFVACGFEHSVAHMYFIPLGILLRPQAACASGANLEPLNWAGFGHNLLPVTLGNLVGGAGMVGLVYWVIYRRGTKAQPPPSADTRA